METFSSWGSIRSFLRLKLQGPCLEGVDAISLVNFAFRLDDTPADFISELQPSIVVKGNEHENFNNPEQSVVQAYGGKLLFSSGGTTFSSLELLRRETEFIDHSSIITPKEYISRHAINVSGLDKLIDQLRSLKICH